MIRFPPRPKRNPNDPIPRLSVDFFPGPKYPPRREAADETTEQPVPASSHSDGYFGPWVGDNRLAALRSKLGFEYDREPFAISVRELKMLVEEIVYYRETGAHHDAPARPASPTIARDNFVHEFMLSLDRDFGFWSAPFAGMIRAKLHKAAKAAQEERREALK